MLRDEAEREADRRNREDERRKRLEFYAFDETAGVDDDGWTVAVRLRRTPPPDEATADPGPATAAAAAAAVSESRPPEPEPEPEPDPEPEPPADAGGEPEPEPDDLQPTQAYDVVAHEFDEGDIVVPVPAPPEPPTEVAPKVPEPVPPPEPVLAAEPDKDEEEYLEDDEDYPEYEDAYYSEAFPDQPYGDEDLDRPGLFVRTIGAVVLIVGWLWLLMLIALAVVIRPDVPSAIALYAVGFVAGLCVLWLGVAIRRS
jgi:hypothetical protein